MTTVVEKYSHWIVSGLRHGNREPGMSHPAEDYLKVLVGLAGGYDEIAKICQHKYVAADVLACLCHITPVPGSMEWRLDLVTTALDSDDVGVLDSAIDVCAVWGEHDREIQQLLESRADTLTENWLSGYAKDVIKDLAEHWNGPTPEQIAEISGNKLRSFMSRPPEDLIEPVNSDDLTLDQQNANLNMMLAKLHLMDSRYLQMCYNINPETNEWSVTFNPKPA